MSALSSQEQTKAIAIAAAEARKAKSCLVPLQIKGTKPPLFLIHPHAGVVFPYYELAFLLGQDRPIYGLQSQGLNKQEKPLKSIEEMAKCYIQAIQTVQPNGPYCLGGWSFGIIVAFEMAQQLHNRGQSLDVLMSLDGKAYSNNLWVNSWEMMRFFLTSVLKEMIPYIVDYFKFEILASPHPDPSRIIVTDSQYYDRTAQIASQLYQERDRPKSRYQNLFRLFPIVWANIIATIRYKAQNYHGKMDLIRSEKPFGNPHRDPSLGWNRLVKEGVNIHCISGHHMTILKQPHVKELATVIRTCLEPED